MTLIPSTAASAVYHDALTTARGWRNLCFLILLLVLLAQLALFFTARFEYISLGGAGTDAAGIQVAADVDDPTTQSTAGDAGVRLSADIDDDWLYMLLYFTLWAGLVFSILLSLTLIFTTLVMLNGRTVGVSREVSAFFWSLVLLLLLIPWQCILNHPTLAGGPFHLPGVLYTWAELSERARFDNGDWLGWMRFAVWPIVALLVLLAVQAKARRGVKEALGEDLGLGDEPLRDRPLT